MPDRQHHPAGHHRRDRGQQDDQRQPHADQDPLHQHQERLLLGEREYVVQLVVRAERHADGDGRARGARPRGVGQRGRFLPRMRGAPVVVAGGGLLAGHVGDQVLRNRRRDVDVAGADPLHSCGPVLGQLDEDQVAAGAPARLLERPGRVLRGVLDSEGPALRAEDARLAERGHAAVLGLVTRGVLRVAQQPVRGQLHQVEAEHGDDQGG